MSNSTTANLIRCAVIGYGGAFNMGRAHGSYIEQTEGLELVAVCDLSPERTEAAKADFPTIKTFNTIESLLEFDEVDLCVIVLPHNLHALISIQCSKAGKHVVVEKPMCVTVAEADAMIEAAQQAGKLLTVFHNRRQDDSFKTLRKILIEEKLIGEIFSVEIFAGNWSAQNPNWWRSVKAVSGGYFYDWGAHFLDWMLGVVPGKMTDINGYFHKRIWHDVTNEDQVQAVVRFDTGCVVNITMSSIAKAGKPTWWILGEKGAVVARNEGGKSFYEVTGDFESNGHQATLKIPFSGDSDWKTFYANVSEHLLKDEELDVKPEQARRIIAVLEGAEMASTAGHSLPLPSEEIDAAFQRKF
jgi:scyllo-inositol 2-dehydrogenase (NADP+)